MALMITLFSAFGIAIALGGYAFPILSEVEKTILDREETTD